MNRLIRPAPVILAVTGDAPLSSRALAHARSWSDDGYWAAFVRAPFTWQRFTNWWIARRWIIPRDPRKE